jgi:thioredoxin reductase (NADPH)
LEVIHLADVIIVGAGPCGISAAIELKKEGFDPLIIEKGCLVNSIYHYPLSMTFFSSADNLEIGGIPFTTINEKPTRAEALAYYRTVARHFELNIHTYEEVLDIEKNGDAFVVRTRKRGEQHRYEAKAVVLATGYYDNPRQMGIPGEELPHVHHYFHDAHPYADQKAVVIGGRNSAIDVALELYHTGAKVTMVYRQKAFHDSVKAWVRPVIENAIEKKRIEMFWESEVEEILPNSVVIRKNGEKMAIPADVVFAMTGYRPDLTLLKRLGGEVDPKTGVPVLSEAMESTVPGFYLAGVVTTGHDSTKIFIENGRHHGRFIAGDLKKKFKA